MIRVTTSTGEAFQADSHTDIVRLMIASERLQARKTLATFMRSTARRCQVWNGARINTDNARKFLASLADAGFILLEDTANPEPQ